MKQPSGAGGGAGSARSAQPSPDQNEEQAAVLEAQRELYVKRESDKKFTALLQADPAYKAKLDAEVDEKVARSAEAAGIAVPEPGTVLRRVPAFQSDYFNSMDDPVWLVEGLMPYGPAVGIIAAGTSWGKTTFASGFGMRYALGTDKMYECKLPSKAADVLPLDKRRVLYLDGEGSERLYQKRVVGTVTELVEETGMEWEEITEQLNERFFPCFPDKTAGVEGLVAAARELILDDLTRRNLNDGEGYLIIVDTLLALSELESENDNAEVSLLLNKFLALRDEFKCNVLLLMHGSKAERTSAKDIRDASQTVRGAGSAADRVDWVLQVTQLVDSAKEDEKIFPIQFALVKNRTGETFNRLLRLKKVIVDLDFVSRPRRETNLSQV